MTWDSSQSSGRGDDVATLIRLAGQRPRIPEEHIEQARQAALEAWRRKSRQRSRTRYLGLAAALAVAASLVLVVLYPPAPGRSDQRAGVGGMMQVRLMAGEARIVAPPSAAPSPLLAPDASVPPGSVIATPDGGRAAILLSSGHSLRLDTGSRVRLADPRTLHLDRGALYLASAGTEASPEPLTVRTSLGVIREIGTQFEVRLAKAGVRVRVREGSIVLNRDAHDHEIFQGTEIELGADGSTTTRTIAVHGPEWGWLSAITPMIDLEGRTARDFLDWVIREQGWRLAFSDESVARSAARIEVAGDLEGMTIPQALDAVLPSCRMVYSVEEGVLRVEAEPAGR